MQHGKLIINGFMVGLFALASANAVANGISDAPGVSSSPDVAKMPATAAEVHHAEQRPDKSVEGHGAYLSQRAENAKKKALLEDELAILRLEAEAESARQQLEMNRSSSRASQRMVEPQTIAAPRPVHQGPDTSAFGLVHAFSLEGEWKALVDFRGSSIDIEKGTTLPGGWRVVSINQQMVTVRRSGEDNNDFIYRIEANQEASGRSTGMGPPPMIFPTQ